MIRVSDLLRVMDLPPGSTGILTQMNGIATAGWTAGSVVILQFASTPTVKNATAATAGFASFKLAGAADFVATADDTMTLVYDGTTWSETARSVN